MIIYQMTHLGYWKILIHVDLITMLNVFNLFE
nr:MAG TPA: hypothetical protein [Crassvirales sp.]